MKRSLRNKLDRELYVLSGDPRAERHVDLDSYLAGHTVRGRSASRPRTVMASGKVPRRVERPRSRGQALLVIALMMTVLILFVGLGVDVGNMMAKRAKLQSAVDASALSAAQLLTGNIVVGSVQTKAYQILEANGVLSPTLANRTVSVNVELRQVHVSAVQRVDTFFMRIVPMWRTVNVAAEATADLNAFAEMNIKPYGKPGVVNELMLQTWGPWSWRRGGDVYSPVYMGGGIAPNPEHPNQPYGYLFRIDVPPSFPDDELVIQIFDPDTYNNPNHMPTPTPYVPPPCPSPPCAPAPATATPNAYDSTYFWCNGALECSSNDQASTNPALKRNGYTRGDWVQAPWTSGRVSLWRVDEYRRYYNEADISPVGVNDYNANWPTETNFSLWHFDPRITSAFGVPEQMSDQPGGAAIVPTYTVRLNNLHTDLAWYEPWDPIKLNDPSCSGHQGTDCFERESNGNFYFYLYVESSNGSSENDYDLRVGPRAANYAQGYDCRTLAGWSAGNPDVCYSNEQFYQQSRTNPSLQDWVDGGARVFAKRALPINLATGDAFPMLYTQVSEKAAGQTLAVKHFDQDCGGSRPCGAGSTYQMQVCVNIGTTTPCNTPNCEPCSSLLNSNCFRDITGGVAYRGPNDGWYCPGCPTPEQVSIPSEGTADYNLFFGPGGTSGSCESSWLRLRENLSYTNDTTVWEMPYKRPRLIK